MRVSESAGLVTSDVDLGRGILHVNRQTYPGRGGLSPRRPRASGGELCRSSNHFARSGIVSPAAKDQATGLIVGAKGGLISTATLRDATHWD